MKHLTIKSIDVMQLTKDSMLDQIDAADITLIINNIAKFSPTHIAISIPMNSEEDYVAGGSALNPVVGYLETWVEAIRDANLSVYWRPTFIEFEKGDSSGLQGLYNTTRLTPTSEETRAIGVAADVLDESDTDSYLARMYQFIQDHEDLFALGDVWAPFPQPDNQGVGSATTDMFTSYAVLGQWLVDLKTVADDAFETHLGYRRDQILTGMTSVIGATVETNQIDSTYWLQIGRLAIEHYLPVADYSTSLDTINTNSGEVDLYIAEWGTTGASGSPTSDDERAESITTVMTVFQEKDYVKGVNYWQAIGESSDASEALLDDTTYEPYEATYNALFSFFKDTSNSSHTRFITRLGAWLWYKGERFRFIGFNKYTLQVNTISQATLGQYFDAARAAGVRVMRFWCFDRDNPRRDSSNTLIGTQNPTAIIGNFRYITTSAAGADFHPNGTFETNTTGWSLDSNFTRSNADSHSGTYSISQNSASGTYQNFTTTNNTTGIAVLASTAYTLKYWYKLSVSGNSPILNINIGSTFGTQIASAFPGNTSGAWVQGTVNFTTNASTTKIWIRIYNNGGTVTGFYDDFTLQTAGTKSLAWHEPTLAHLDLVLDEARKRGIKLDLVLHDGNNYEGAAYPAKITYNNWANQIYGTNLNTHDQRSDSASDFFISPYPRQLFKDFILGLVNRVNTINGRLYRDDDTIMSWELGNEVRFDNSSYETGNYNTPNAYSVITMNAWITDVSLYIKSIDPNHLVQFGSCSFAATPASDPTGSVINGNDYRTDRVWTGSYNGIHYPSVMAIKSVDIFSCHSYPNQSLGSNSIWGYGYNFGFKSTARDMGYRYQLRHFVETAKSNGRPLIMGEIGYAREDIGTMEGWDTDGRNALYSAGWDMYPRRHAFESVFQEIFLKSDGDGVIVWDATVLGGGSFSVGMGEVGTASYWGANENSNDSLLMHRIKGLNTELVSTNKRARVM